MRVLEINSVYGCGSTGKIAVQIADIVNSHEGESLVAYGRDFCKQKEEVSSYKIGNGYTSYIHAGLSRITDRQGFYSKRATKQLVEKIIEFNPDIIHLHNLHGYYLHLPTLFNSLATIGTPIVWTLHDCWTFTGHCSYFDYIGCDKWKTGCYNCPQKKSYPSSYLLDQSKRNYQEKKELFTSLKNLTIVTPSKWLAQLVKQSFLKDSRVEVIYNGIDTEIFSPTPSTWKSENNIDKPVILACAAQWGQSKGFSDVLEIAKLLPEYQVVIVGVSKKQKGALPKNIIGITRTHNAKELAKLYTLAEVFINPTYEDNFPTVNLEALACGTPVVTYNTGGSPESINNRVGIVVPKGAIVELVKAIKITIKNSSIDKEKLCIEKGMQYSKEDKFEEYYAFFLHGNSRK